MKSISILSISTALMLMSCGNGQMNDQAAVSEPVNAGGPAGGQAMVNDDVSRPNVVKVAMASKDHSTLVSAVQAADLVNSLSNNGPFTVFAPTNAAFDALPEGTLNNLMKPENKSTLSGILEHHVFVAALDLEDLKDGQVLGMVDGTNAKISIKDGKYYIDDAAILGSVTASNGVVHVIDKVVLPGQ